LHVTAIIAAAGRGVRLGGAVPKQFLDVGGEPMLARSVRAFLAHPAIAEVIVALSPELAAAPPAYLRVPRVRVVAGGSRRQDSVANAFHAASPESELFVVHDAARPFATADLIARTVAAAAESGAAVAAVVARDTVKRAADRDGARVVRETLPRDAIYLAQTPQAFRRTVLAAALAQQDDATDEAALAERAGFPVRLVDGEPGNIKITTGPDLALAQALLAQQHQHGKPARTGRAGTGYDLHRLVDGRALVLAGVSVPTGRGALGHSDADVICHAVTDAILGALALGDIGAHFPDSDVRWKDASSIDLLQRVVALAGEQGYEVGNVDVTVLLERPKLREHVAAMRRSLAAALAIDESRVSVKAKTNEGVDAVGRGEAIAAHAVALVRSRH
jgi:2-C-methyl-D-erythritol 4-phosphate cytidylyltransferase/2-C-methyl-D-erythritol 2,4-cyclodiphosphate synthase